VNIRPDGLDLSGELVAQHCLSPEAEQSPQEEGKLSKDDVTSCDGLRVDLDENLIRFGGGLWHLRKFEPGRRS
jgi:hypothetical protein